MPHGRRLRSIEAGRPCSACRSLYILLKKLWLDCRLVGRRVWAASGVVALGAIVAAVAFGAGGIGSAGAAPVAAKRQLQCPFIRNGVPGWQAVFGRATAESAANALQARLMRAGFKHLIVQVSCAGGYEIVLRGLCPFGLAYDLQQEARKAGFNALLEYKKPLDTNPDLVAVFGHFRTRAAAEDFKPRVDRVFQHVSIIQDGGCANDWEVAVTGVNSPAQGADFAEQARRLGFSVSIELN